MLFLIKINPAMLWYALFLYHIQSAANHEIPMLVSGHVAALKNSERKAMVKRKEARGGGGRFQRRSNRRQEAELRCSLQCYKQSWKLDLLNTSKGDDSVYCMPLPDVKRKIIHIYILGHGSWQFWMNKLLMYFFCFCQNYSLNKVNVTEQFQWKIC